MLSCLRAETGRIKIYSNVTVRFLNVVVDIPCKYLNILSQFESDERELEERRAMMPRSSMQVQMLVPEHNRDQVRSCFCLHPMQQRRMKKQEEQQQQQEQQQQEQQAAQTWLDFPTNILLT